MLLFALCLASSVFGLVLIRSASGSLAQSHVYVQSIAILIGIALFVLFSLIDIEIIADRYRALFVIGGVFIATLFLWGVAGDTGNRAWIRFSFGFGVQPAELVKIPFIIVLARMCAAAKDRRTLNSVVNVLKLLVVFAAYFVLIILSSADLGSALVYAFILLVMLYMGGVYLRWFAIGFAAIASMAPLIWQRFFTQEHRDRILVLFRPDEIDPDRLGKLWQTDQSRTAISFGRLFGAGIGKGAVTQSGRIPSQHADFIFSAAGEELGFVGVIAILLLLSAIIVRCLQIGIKSNDRLGMLVCSGIAAMFIAQTLENVGMCLGITPVVGLTLPFFSYGGSSILTSFIAAGIASGIRMRRKPARLSARYYY
ncbi:MAG: FtsW/RodA/SpoVE family cell cycle protein [Oscillospiraceae bacterium]|jgi:rod shape determining protein RodA|nr:FtsW/RodA/SpoVE family cell cycle protein [Oscillospiraceae bacterium]